MMRFDNITVSVVLKYGTTDTEENALCYIPRRYNTLQRERERERRVGRKTCFIIKGNQNCIK